MSDRALQILQRFPAHFDAARPDKLVYLITQAAATDLDAFAADMARVRRAHRLGHADTRRDVRELAKLHAIGAASLSLLLERRRLFALAERTLLAATSSDERKAAAGPVLDLFGLAPAASALGLFSEVSDAEFEAAALALAAALGELSRHATELDATRERVATLSRVSAVGNGTLRALLETAANALDLELDLARNARSVADAPASWFNPSDGLVHTRDRFLHASYTIERFPLRRVVRTALPERLLAVTGPTVLIHAAEQLELEAEVILAALADLGIPITRADATLDLPTLRALSGKLGFALELRGKGSIEVGMRLTVRELGALTLLPSATLTQELARLGHPGLGPASLLDGELAALGVRSRGFELVQRLEAALGDDVIGVEENPFRDESFESGDLVHGSRFRVLRRGFSRRGLKLRFHGVQGFTQGPMLVNLDEGRGIGFAGSIPEGEEVVFELDGSVRRSGGGESTGLAFSWHGACFADADGPHQRDFCFSAEDGTGPKRVARFALATPEAALDREMVFPHGGGVLEMPGIRVGETRFAFFVTRATFGSRDSESAARTATPRTSAGVFTGPGSEVVSSFAAAPPRPEDDAHADSDWDEPVAGRLTLEWREREAYALRLLISHRFAVLDQPELTVLAAVRAAVERVRPAGVDVRVEYLDDAWTLGSSALPGDLDADPTAFLLGGTRLGGPEGPPPP